MKKKVILILGSMRPSSNSRRVGQMVTDNLLGLGYEVDVVDPMDTKLAFPGTEDYDGFAAAIQSRANEAQGAVFVTPEYDGSFSSALKLVIEHFGYPSCLGKKPAALIGCAGGKIGAVKALEHLRSLLSHTGVFVMPLAHSIPEVHNVFDANNRCVDSAADTGVKNVVQQFDEFLNSHS